MAGESVWTDPEVGAQLEAARELLGRELAYLAELHGGHQVYRAAEGDTLAFGLEVGDIVPIDHSLCSVVERSLPSAIGDTGRRQGVRSYVCVPVRLGDGRLYGSLCSVSERANRSLGGRQIRLMEVLAMLIADR